MKLPVARPRQSTDMGGAMRDPVLQKNRKQYQATEQRFHEMPTNYNQVGTAQANAALAQGNMMGAVAKAGIDIGQAIIDVDYVEQQADAPMLQAEYTSALAGFYANEGLRNDLSDRDKDGEYNYKAVGDNFANFKRDLIEDLGKRFKITDPGLLADWNAKKIGIDSTAQIKIDSVVDRAKDQRIRLDGEELFAGVTTPEEWDIWEAT